MGILTLLQTLNLSRCLEMMAKKTLKHNQDLDT